jgi:hypothetical protein
MCAPLYSVAMLRTFSSSRCDKWNLARVRNASISGFISGIWPSFAQQYAEDACDPQPSPLGRDASVPLVEQNQIRRHLQR